MIKNKLVHFSWAQLQIIARVYGGGIPCPEWYGGGIPCPEWYGGGAVPPMIAFSGT